MGGGGGKAFSGVALKGEPDVFFIYMLMIIVMCQSDTGLCSKVIFT